MNKTKNAPGRPRVHEVGKWTAVQFRMPTKLRETLFALLDEKNAHLAYRLSLNSLLLELLELGMNVENARLASKDTYLTTKLEPSSEEHSKHILQTTPNSLNSK